MGKTKEEIWQNVCDEPESINRSWTQCAYRAMQLYHDQFKDERPGQINMYVSEETAKSLSPESGEQDELWLDFFGELFPYLPGLAILDKLKSKFHIVKK